MQPATSLTRNCILLTQQR